MRFLVVIFLGLVSISSFSATDSIYLECSNYQDYKIFEIDRINFLVTGVATSFDGQVFTEKHSTYNESASYSPSVHLLVHSAYEPGEEFINYSQFATKQDLNLNEYKKSPIQIYRAKHEGDTDYPSGATMDKLNTFAVGASYRMAIKDIKKAISEKDFETLFLEKSHRNKNSGTKKCRVVPLI